MTLLPLPNDVIHDILIGLPVKDLVRFRCLSKYVCTKIDGPDFVAEHLSRSHRKLVFSGPIHSLHEYNYNAIDLDLDHEILRGIKLNNPLITLQGYDGYRILASCNGSLLLCNKVLDYVTFLWNPFTRRWKMVPLSHTRYFGIGLGHDSATNSYKIVAVEPARRPLSRITVKVFDAATNTLSSEVVTNPFPTDKYTCIYEIASLGVFAKGALHWLVARTWSLNYKDILSFDIGSRKFVKMLPPLPRFPRRWISLQVLEGQLFLCGRKGTYLPSTELELQLFELVDEDEGKGSIWRKLCKIKPMELNGMIGHSRRLEDVKLLDYSKDGNKILLQYPTSRHATNGSQLTHLFWYEFVKGKYKRARISHHPSPQYLRSRFEASFCLESLVSLGAGAQFDGSNL